MVRLQLYQGHCVVGSVTVVTMCSSLDISDSVTDLTTSSQDSPAPALSPAPAPQQWGTVLSARQLHNQFYRSGKIVTEV